ncbi:pilin N-terminal domain-containing protein [Pilibacter termitis]|nr:pilin N-terminal domain-containing protein [Pilibacter termitis]
MLHDGTLVDKVTDNSGKELAPLGNVEYTITRMEAIPHKGSATTYQEATGDQSFVKTIVTDSNGKAELTGLAKGIYRVSETASEFVTSPMEPVLLALPMKNATGYLTDVYLYPKSNMAFPDLPKTGTETPATQDKLLNTSGNIGDYQMLIYMIISMVIAGMIGLIISKRREQA